MDPYEFKTFTDILQRYSDLCKPVKGTGRGKKKNKHTVSTLSKQLGMNFNKMDPAEVQFFTTLVEKYSTTYLSMLPKKGHGKI